MDKAAVRIAFEKDIIILKLADILPLKQVSDAIKAMSKYRRIAKSISEIGIIEPLVVSKSLGSDDATYHLLDGHTRRAILMDAGEAKARCIVSHDDESFTYNKRINHLATVQEHYMIVKALERGVSEEKLAKALDVNIKHIQRRKSLLDGICPEVVEMLKDKIVNPATFEALRKLKPMRQIEAAELMQSAANFTATYAKMLLTTSKQGDLVKPERSKNVKGMTQEQLARMEREMAALQQDFKAVETSYGEDVLHLVIASGYVSKLTSNRKIERYLNQNHPELLEKFNSIVSATSLDSPGPEGAVHH